MHIVASYGPDLKPQPDGTLVKALARAWRWQRMLESSEYGSLGELADAERITRSYVSRVLRLMLLAPEIVEHILDGRGAPSLLQLLKPFPLEWGSRKSGPPDRARGCPEGIPAPSRCSAPAVRFRHRLAAGAGDHRARHHAGEAGAGLPAYWEEQHSFWQRRT
jgi:hypothetical protein